jgi:hypothetical protein
MTVWIFKCFELFKLLPFKAATTYFTILQIMSARLAAKGKRPASGSPAKAQAVPSAGKHVYMHYARIGAMDVLTVYKE